MSTPGGAVVTAIVAGAFAWFLVRHTIEDVLWRFDQRRVRRHMDAAETEAGMFLAAQQPPPPPEHRPHASEDCQCDLCTRKVTFEEWLENTYCEHVFGETYQDVHRLEDYWAEDWEVAAS